ncbi:GNAT family N-acetyltransferase [Dactylosporangium sp. AC04546]|uniref:GNAT family N-acetyltransferase n=1 Tax=Dactylosporangium sp. AC04546 TaxID=2862460 RepID=UPI001EDE1379|nr:GNAT family N-acetyltransferase [Dactylosporangium sp. AC04546]WVK87937.1 GNAT family N-acetyltransferase [Dactylosporangium sp. AC04546]
MHGIVAYPEAATPAGLRAQVAELRRSAWPGPDFAHDPALRPLSLLLVDDDAVLAALDILHKDLDHAGERWSAAGLSTVVTHPEHRGRGHGSRLVTAARERIAADVGIFTCDRPLAPFYTRSGWVELPGTVLVGGTESAPFPSDRPGFDKVTMASFRSDRAIRRRRAFEHSRILLYCGQIDRLW